MSRRNWWVLLVMIPVGMVAGRVLARVHLYLVPRVYESEVIFEIKHKPRITGMPSPMIRCGTEFEVLKSTNVLLKVSQHLELESSWKVDEETALRKLKSAVQVTNIRGTDLKRVTVTSADPVEARDIARELVKTYGEWRTELEKEANGRMLAELKRVVQEQEEKAEEARKVLNSIANNENHVNDAGFIEAKRHYEEQISLIDQLKLKLVSWEIDSSMIETVNVVIDEPDIPNKPVGLGERAIMLNWMIGGALFAPLLTMPIMALLNRRRRPEMG